MQKSSFYKTFQESVLAGVVDRFYNDVVGGIENHYYDTDELKPIRKEDLINQIVDDILSSKHTLLTEDGIGIEQKHIRFMGSQRVREIVEHRVNFRYSREEFPEAFED